MNIVLDIFNFGFPGGKVVGGRLDAYTLNLAVVQASFAQPRSHRVASRAVSANLGAEGLDFLRTVEQHCRATAIFSAQARALFGHEPINVGSALFHPSALRAQIVNSRTKDINHARAGSLGRQDRLASLSEPPKVCTQLRRSLCYLIGETAYERIEKRLEKCTAKAFGAFVIEGKQESHVACAPS